MHPEVHISNKRNSLKPTAFDDCNYQSSNKLNNFKEMYRQWHTRCEIQLDMIIIIGDTPKSSYIKQTELTSTNSFVTIVNNKVPLS